MGPRRFELRPHPHKRQRIYKRQNDPKGESYQARLRPRLRHHVSDLAYKTGGLRPQNRYRISKLWLN